MFTGIVSGMAQILESKDKGGVVRLDLAFPSGALNTIQVGASVSISGVCLTLVSFEGDLGRFDVIQESLERTTLGSQKAGNWVNYERSARFGDEIGGHLLSGHILGCVETLQVREHGDNLALFFSLPHAFRPYILEKGFVALDGVSLTIGQVISGHEAGFWVHLIPETQRVTTFGTAELGRRINLEIDSTTQAVVETVTRLVAAGQFQS